jgi:hypothetical protein
LANRPVNTLRSAAHDPAEGKTTRKQRRQEIVLMRFMYGDRGLRPPLQFWAAWRVL